MQQASSIDVLTIAEWMESKGTGQDGDGGISGLLLEITPKRRECAYARIVRDRARRRELIQLGTDLQQWAMRDDAETALAKLKSATESLRMGQERNLD